jgi:ATPase subunit of ABC transporter with duplicated ATPase domains
LHADSGDLEIPPGWLIGHVAQDTPALPDASLDFVVGGDEEFAAIERELAAAEASHDAMANASPTSMAAAGHRRLRGPRPCRRADARPRLHRRRLRPARWPNSPAAGACG